MLMASISMGGDRTKPERLTDPDASSDDRTYAMLMHLSLLAHLATGGLGIVVALVMWLVKRGESPFIDDHGREAMNYQISLIIYLLLSVAIGAITCGVGLVLMPLIYVFGFIGMILAATSANRGEYFRYPATIRFLQ